MSRQIQMDSGDGMRIGEDVGYFYLKCCKCELQHLVTVEWELVNGQKDAIVLRYYSCDPAVADSPTKEDKWPAVRQ